MLAPFPRVQVRTDFLDSNAAEATPHPRSSPASVMASSASKFENRSPYDIPVATAFVSNKSKPLEMHERIRSDTKHGDFGLDRVLQCGHWTSRSPCGKWLPNSLTHLFPRIALDDGFPNSSCPVCTHIHSFVFNDLDCSHLRTKASFAGQSAPRVHQIF